MRKMTKQGLPWLRRSPVFVSEPRTTPSRAWPRGTTLRDTRDAFLLAVTGRASCVVRGEGVDLRPLVGIVGAALIFLLSTSRLTLAEANAGWKGEWETTLEVAQREGQVTLLTNRGFSDFFAEFQKAYPKIRVVEGFSGPVSQRTQILFTERRANIHRFDISFGSPLGHQLKLWIDSGTVDPVPPLLVLPEVVDHSKWWGGKHHYMDTEKRYFFVFEGALRAGDIVYNTKLVNPREVGSYWDLVAGKWRGKIVIADPRDPRTGGISGVGLMFFYNDSRLGPEYVKRLFGESDVTLSRDYTQMMNWLAVGKSALNFFSSGVDEAIKQGLPVQEFTPAQFKEGGLLGPIRGVIALINRAPHPNAAKVFINWALSREGQVAFQKISAADNRASGNSMREDIPKDVIPPQYRRNPEVAYLEATYEVYQTRPKILKFVEKLLANAGK